MTQIRYRKLSNGLVVVPHRGEPPTPPDGYERTATDAYAFQPILIQCEDRSSKMEKSSCCHGAAKVSWCTYYDRKITPFIDCQNCERYYPKEELPAFVTFFTPTYEPEYENLKRSAATHNLQLIGFQIEDQGSWIQNVQMKPKIIKETLERLDENQAVIFVDADAEICERPILFQNLPCDIGVHYKDGHELLSGTIYLKNNERVKRLLDMWIERNSENPEEWDQRTLQAILDENPELVTVYKLPASYCGIFDLMADQYVEPVIKHWQASRRLKNVSANRRGNESPKTQ